LVSIELRKKQNKQSETFRITVFGGTFSIVWYSGEHDVSETGSVSILRRRWGEDTYSVRLLKKS
jgi:hypothetical protein